MSANSHTSSPRCRIAARCLLIASCAAVLAISASCVRPRNEPATPVADAPPDETTANDAAVSLADSMPGSRANGLSIEGAILLHGGRIWTGDPERPEVEALLIVGDHIAAVGADAEFVGLALSSAIRVDLDGRRVVPGFIDSHVHFLEGGAELIVGELRDAASEEEFARRLGAVIARLPLGTWVTAGSWDHENWPDAKLPTREVIDRHTPKHPVFVSRLDGHMALANSLAMRLAGITRDTKAPAGGAIVRDDDGEPTGVFKDTAMALISRHIPAPSRDEQLDRARTALRHAAALGVTGVHDMLGSYAAIDIYQELRERDELTLRVTAYTPIASHERWGAVAVRGGFGDDFVRLAGVKAFADGSLGSSTAYFFEAYLDSPGNYGLALAQLGAGESFERSVASSVAHDLQVATHAIGDRAIRSLLDIYSRLEPGETARHRFRIEHSQHIHPDDVARYGELGVIASMQPFHAIDDGRWAEKRIGKERLKTTYAFRDLIDTGATLAFGSDWPVAPLSPIRGIYAAVTRRTLDGKHPNGWVPGQKITVEEALRAYTAGGAYAAFAEDRVGTLVPGKLADLVVLDRDILAVAPEEIESVGVAMTMVGGRIVYP